jgi:4-amino-4-deoxy-L-arabinose transferase-like glycosyltransferase
VSSDSLPYPAPRAILRQRSRRLHRVERLFARPELLGLLGLTATLNLWNLAVNGWANTYYSAAVRAMSTGWHDFLYASLDKSGLMTVDKPPLGLWVEALSARIFGFHPLSILVPEALMGIAAVALLYDIVARRFGRAAGFVGGLALATTPITVAIARHNNPDELLILCSVAAVWAALRALDTGRARWLVTSGVLIGLGFETKMGVALLIVPGIVAAWIWAARCSLWARVRALLAAGTAMVVVGGAWPLLVTLTPAADRPWISGTSDNSIWSLIFGYNGLGRVAGQTGGPAGGGGTAFGGSTGLLRLLQTGLGDQAGWLFGFTLVAGVALLVLTRLRRRDPRTGWLIVIGGAFLVSAVVFSYAGGIFHPYYISFVAPFAAALVGAGAGLMLPRSVGGAGRGPSARVIAPLAVAGGAITELAVLEATGGALSWAVPLVIVVGAVCAVALCLRLSTRLRAALVAGALAALLAAPATWAAETLGHATSSTFPAGGPASASAGGSGGGFGGGPPGGGGSPFRGVGGSGGFPGPPSGAPALSGAPAPAGGGPGAGGSGPGRGGGFAGGGANLTAVIRYVEAHGGGTIGVESQSAAAAAILSANANVAGLGGFSGRESSVTARWIASEVRSGKLSWLLVTGTQTSGLPGDTRSGSQAALEIVERVAQKITVKTPSGASVTLYHLAGSAGAILRAAEGT